MIIARQFFEEDYCNYWAFDKAPIISMSFRGEIEYHLELDDLYIKIDNGDYILLNKNNQKYYKIDPEQFRKFYDIFEVV